MMKKIRLQLRNTSGKISEHDVSHEIPSITKPEDSLRSENDETCADSQSKTFNKIVFSGGGLRGCIHIGVVRYLEEKHLINQIDCWIGTSIGSLIATLVVLTYTSDQLEQIMLKFDYHRYSSMDVTHLFEHFGFDTFNKINTLIANLFAKKKFAPHVTFRELFQRTNKHLILNAVCLNTHANTFFDYQTTPEMPVIIAIRASMSLPFVFGSVNYRGLTYVDGGVLNNFPIDHPCLNDSSQTVLGINLDNT